MANTPAVSVGTPDERGLRKVIIDGKTAGQVWSPRELHRVLRRAGLAFEQDIHWLGGDSTVWPDRAGRRRLIGTCMAVGLLTSAMVLAKIGIADFSDALTYGGRIAGFTFLLLSLVEICAAVATFDYWRKRRVTYSGPVVLFGVMVALGIGSAMLIAQIRGRPDSGYMVLWIVLTLWASWALWLLLSRSRAWEGIRNPKRIAIGAIIPTLLAGANLTYSQFYVPYTTAPLVQTAAEFRTPSLNRNGNAMHLPVRLHVKNSGKVPVYVLGSIFWIKGLPQSHVSKHKLIHSDEWVTPPGHVLNPGEEIAQDVVAEIPQPDKLSYETVVAHTEVYVIRKDRMTMNADYERSGTHVDRLGAEAAATHPAALPDSLFRYQAEITNSNEILNVTRGPQRVTFWRGFDHKEPFIYANVAPPGENKTLDMLTPTNANKESIERYGLARLRGSIAQTPFMELLEKARGEHSATDSPPRTEAGPAGD